MKTRSALVLCIIIMHLSVIAQVKIGNNPTSINSASLLELETTNQGFVLPRVSISNVSSSSPLAAGLLTGTVVYNTNSTTTGGSGAGIYLWDGTKWVSISTGTAVSSSAWLLTGNSGLDATSNFIGTTDAVDFVARTNNAERMRILGVNSGSSKAGWIGMGIAVPRSSLDVTGDYTNKNVLTLQNTSSTGFTSVDMLDNTGALKGTFGYANTGTGGSFGGRAYFNSYGSDLLFTANSGAYHLFLQGGTGYIGVNTNTPSERLHVVGNIYLTGAFMPGGSAGTSGYILTSAGAGIAPTWNNLNTLSWSLTGNSGTSYATNFLGTTDNKSMRFRTNNVQRMIIDSLGSVGIGINNPSYALSVLSASNPLYLSGVQSTSTFSTDSVLTINAGVVKKTPYSSLSGISWNLTGNAGTNSAINFLGTTDNHPLKFKVNNTIAGYIDSSGALGSTFFGSNAGYKNTTGNGNTFIGAGADSLNTAGSFNTATGYQTGYSNTSGSSNIFTGYQAGYNNTTASGNIFTGFQTGYKNTIGQLNVFSGYWAGYLNTTGSNNGFSGYLAGFGNTTGSNNTFIGSQSGSTNTTGANNTLVGTNSNVLSSGLSNAGAIGYNAKVALSNSLVLGDTTSGGNAVNVGIGVRNPLKRLHIDAAPIASAGTSDSLKIDNLASSGSSYNKALLVIDSATGYVSKQSLNTLAANNYWSLTGNSGTNYSSNFLGTTDNVSMRFRTNNVQRMLIDSLGRVGIGITNPSYALSVLSASNPLYLSGVQATSTFSTDSVLTINAGVVKKTPYSSLSGISWNLTGNAGTNSAINFLGTTDNHPLKFEVNNTFAGYIDSSGGAGNTFFGYSAGSSNTTGTHNTGIGNEALNANTSASNNTANGYQALFSNTIGTGNTAGGYSSLYSNTTGQYNTAYGLSTLKNNTTGSYNVAVGQSALQNNTTGANNSVVGEDGMLNNTTGRYLAGLGTNALHDNTTGSYNNAVGESTLFKNTTGGYNIAMGSYTLYNNSTASYNIALGYYAGNLTTSGGNNIFIGSHAGVINTTGSNNVLIGTSSNLLSASLTNAGAIGYSAKVGSSNSLVLGDTATGGNAVNVGIGVRNPLKRLHIDAAPIASAGTSDSLKIDNLASSVTSYNKALLVIDSATGYVSKQSLNTLAANNYWSLTGNSGTNYSTNFLGTTDNAGLHFKTNNTEQMIIDSLGHVGIGSSAFDPYNPAKLLVDYGTTTSNSIVNLKGNIDDYLQINLKNNSNGGSASSDYVATADDGTDSTYYVDMGINSSNYAFSTDNWGGAHDAYLYSNSKNLYIGTQASGSDVIFLVGGGRAVTNSALRIKGSNGNVVVGKGEASTTPIGNTLRAPTGYGTNIAGGTLTVTGGGGTGNAAGGNLYLGSGVSSGTGASGIITLSTASTERMRIDASGNVGIGTTSSSYPLSVLAASNPLYLSGVQATSTFSNDSILTINAGIVKKAAYSSLAAAGNWSLTGNGGTTAGTNFIGTTDAVDFVTKTKNIERMRITSAGLVGIGTNAPASDLTIYQSAGSGSSRGITFTGNSISGNNSGTGFLMSLGYNTSGNKQLWLGDADYAGNASGSFARFVSNGTNFPTFDAVSGDNALRRYIALGVAGDANSGVIFGTDNTGVKPGSQVWDNGNMTIGNGYKSNAAPSNGLLVQGNVGIGTASPSSALSVLAASNPLYLSGVQATGTFTTDSILTIYNGVVKKAPSGATLNSFSVTAPLTYDNTTGVFGINQATTSTDGYLSSTDWNTFNNKVGSITLNAPSIFTTPVNFAVSSGSATGTLSLNTETVGTVFAGPAGPASLGGAVPTFRALVASDIPSLASSYIQNQSTVQASSNFNISGNGTIGTNLGVTGTSTLTGAVTSKAGITNTGILTSSGGIANVNTSSNFATNINTGSSTSNITIGNSSNNILLPKFNTTGSLFFTSATTGQIAATGTDMIWDDANNRLGIGTTAPGYELSVLSSSNPLYLSGVQATSTFSSDSILTIYNGVVKKTPYSSLPSGGSSGWALTGNSGTSAGTNFLGTTDAQPLIIKSLSRQLAYFDGNLYSIALGFGAVNGSSDHNIAIGYNATTNNQYTLALGYNATATGVRSVALGNGASATTASGAESVAIGYNAISSAVQTVSLGYQALASGSYGVAIGYTAQATASQSTAIGYSSLASAQYANAIGYNAHATGIQSTAIGYNAQTGQSNTILLGDAGTTSLHVGIGTATPSAKLDIVATSGNNPLEMTGLPTGVAGTDNILTINSSGVVGYVTPATFSGNYWGLSGNAAASGNFLGTTNTTPLQFKFNSTAAGYLDANNTSFGTSATATSGLSNTAIGYSSTASNSATAVGANSNAANASNTAIGNTATANNSDHETAIGASALANAQYNTSLGYNAQAISNSQATAIGTTALANAYQSTALGYGSQAISNAQTTALGVSALSNAQYNTAVGYNAQAISNSQTTAIGSTSKANAQYNTAVGYNAQSITNSYGTAVGTNSNTTGQYTTAIGAETDATGQYSTALGYNAQAVTNNQTTAIGANSVANSINATALGYNAKAQASNATAIGYNASTSQANALVLGDATSTVNVGIGTSTPNTGSKLDVAGSFKLGSVGTVEKNVVSTSASVNTTVQPQFTAVTILGISLIQLNAGTSYTDVTVTLPTTLTSTQASANVSPSFDLPAGVSIAFARVISTTQVKVRFLNANTTAQTITGNLYVTVTEF